MAKLKWWETLDYAEIQQWLQQEILWHYEILQDLPRSVRIGSRFSGSFKRQFNTVCDIHLKNKWKPKQYMDEPYIKICRRMPYNKDAFRIELESDLSDIYGNNNDEYNINYLLFAEIVKNKIDGTRKIYAYVFPKDKVMNIVEEIMDLHGGVEHWPGGSVKVNGKIKDKHGNCIKYYRKNPGIVLTNEFINEYAIDKFEV
jgi:hypothetical protein